MKDNHGITTYLNKVEVIMDYLCLHCYCIPHFDLPLPIEVNGLRYRTEKIFRYAKATRNITYIGWNKDYHSVVGSKTDEIEIHGIAPTSAFAERIYSFMRDECMETIKRRTKSKTVPDIVGLILRFNNMDFLIEG